MVLRGGVLGVMLVYYVLYYVLLILYVLNYAIGRFVYSCGLLRIWVDVFRWFVIVLYVHVMHAS